MWRLVENLWNFFELPVTTGTFPDGRGGDEGGRRGGRGARFLTREYCTEETARLSAWLIT